MVLRKSVFEGNARFIMAVPCHDTGMVGKRMLARRAKPVRRTIAIRAMVSYIMPIAGIASVSACDRETNRAPAYFSGSRHGSQRSLFRSPDRPNSRGFITHSRRSPPPSGSGRRYRLPHSRTAERPWRDRLHHPVTRGVAMSRAMNIALTEEEVTEHCRRAEVEISGDRNSAQGRHAPCHRNR